jgi:hypothetical protein
MTKTEVKTYPLGLYKVYWKSGGFSLAAIGMLSNGDRWLAPINWITPTVDQKHWRSVARIVALKARN